MEDEATATMTFSTSDGTAKLADDDYEAATGSITITGNGPDEGITVPPITLVTLTDERNERDETFMFTTGAVAVAQVGGGKFTITIEDDDTITATIRPSKDVSVIEGQPASFTVTLSGGTSTEPVTVRYRTADGSATAPGDYTALSGTLTFANDSETRTFTLRTRDDDELESAETLVVRLSDGNSAGKVDADVSTEVTITDNDSISVSLEAPPSTVTEGESASFVVKLSGATLSDLVVSYGTSGGSGAAGAIAGQDYNEVSGTLTFSAGSGLTQTFTVETIEDKLNEATETFTVTLGEVSLPASAELGVTDATLEILDNDALTAKVTADDKIVAEGDPATFTVELIPDDVRSTGDVMVAYTVGGSAKPDDYTMTDRTLTLGEGEPTGTITIATMADDEREPDEELTVTLVRAEPVDRVTVDMTPATTTIIDPPAVTIGDASAAESAAAIMFEVKLSAGSPRQVTVSYDTEDGTAKAGEDYTEANGTLTFAAMVELATISIALRDDRLDEEDETFTVRLSDPMYGRLGDTGIRQRVRSSMTTIRPQSRSMTPARRRALERSRSG